MIGLTGMFAGSAFGQDATAMALASSMGTNSLAIVTWEMDEGAGPQRFSGLGVCVEVDDEGGGTLMAMGFSAASAPEDYLDITVILPGVEGEKLEGTLQGIDPLTSLAFIRVEQAHDCRPVQFARESGLSVGDEVVSVGLLPGELGHIAYVGKAYVSTSIRTPEKVFIVAGGELTQVGSLVLDSEGNVVGLVNQQMWSPWQMVIQRQAVNVPVRGQQWTDSFLPVEEFAEVLDRIPDSPDQVEPVPWIGALSAETVPKNLWAADGLTSPGVKLHDVIPGYPADKAGLVNGDIIVAINGEPVEQLATPDLTASQAMRNLTELGVGAQVTISYIRDHEEHTATVAMTAWPTRPGQAPRYIDISIGVRVREKVELDQYIDKSATAKIPGLIVLSVATNSPADQGGLRPGDLLTSIAGQPVRTVEVYKELMAEQRASTVTNSIDVLVRRGDQDKAISIRLD